MANLSLAAANLIYSISGVLIVLGAVLGVVGTVGAFWSDGIRERYADERIAANEARTAEARAKAAEAEARAAEADLARTQLEARLGPRRIGPAVRAAFIAAVAPLKGLRVSVNTSNANTEAKAFAQDLLAVLQQAGINAKFETDGNMMGAGAIPPIRLFARPNHKAVLENLAGALINAGVADAPVVADLTPNYLSVESDVDIVISSKSFP